FFFQAEDGIRDDLVTGVQTCALPILTSHGFRGAYLTSRHSVSVVAIAGDGTAMERDYDFSSALHAGDLDDAAQVGRNAGERAVKIGRASCRERVAREGRGGGRRETRQ